MLSSETTDKKYWDKLTATKEIEFYYSQKGKAVDDIINLRFNSHETNLRRWGILSSLSEWNTWRVFLAIDTLANKPYGRNFKLDDELQPVNHLGQQREYGFWVWEFYSGDRGDFDCTSKPMECQWTGPKARANSIWK